jgi:hypothetical protein
VQQTNPQNLTPAPASSDLVTAQAITVSPDQLGSQLKNLEALQERASQLELRASDMGVRVGQLADRRARASDAERASLDKQMADAQHDMSATMIELTTLHKKISQLEQVLSPQTAITIAPPAPQQTSELNSEQIMQIVGGGGMLLIPLVLVLARNLWIRGSRKARPVAMEASADLQRIEQAIEAIAVEVERIGEAQRFSTKLLTERQPDALPNRAAAPVARREPGTITPH